VTLMYPRNIVVVGYGVDALVYAYEIGATIIVTKEVRPHPLQLLSEEYPQKDSEAYMQYGFVGNRSCDLYDFLLFNLSMAGRAPLAGRVVSAEEIESGKLLVVAEGGYELEIESDKIYHFEPQISATKKIVLDWINVRRGQKHEVTQIETTSDFVNCIQFYPTYRIPSSKTSGLKDAVSISYLTNEQLLDSDYSDFIVRKKVKHLMEQEGIRGPKNGKDPNNPSKHKYYSIKLESRAREVYPLMISTPDLPTISSTLQDVYLSQVSRWTSDFNGTTV